MRPSDRKTERIFSLGVQNINSQRKRVHAPTSISKLLLKNKGASKTFRTETFCPAIEYSKIKKNAFLRSERSPVIEFEVIFGALYTEYRLIEGNLK